MRKICNNCGFQQDEFLNLGGRNYCKSCNSEINNRYGSEQEQAQIQLTAHQRKTIHDILFMTIEGLEKHIEVAGYYPDWEQRKQIPNNKVVVDGLEDSEQSFKVSLFGLKKSLKDRPPFLHEELKEEYYKWIDATRIDVKNCPERLKGHLSQTNEVLEGGGDEFAKETFDKANEYVQKMSDKELDTELNRAFINIQDPLKTGRESEQFLAGKRYDEVDITKRFAGDAGRQVGGDFKQITRAGTSSSSQVIDINRDYVPVNNENEVSPEQLVEIQRVENELTQEINVPIRTAVPVANGALAFVVSLAGGISWFKRR